MTTLASALAVARISWQCNFTLGDERWRLKQLYNLYQLLIDNRDELITCSTKSSSSCEAHEKELALLVGDIHQHISHVVDSLSKKGAKSLQLERNEIARPAGVSMIICELENPLRFMLGPLAASIAAGNVTIVATRASHDEEFVSLLARFWPKYLDPDCNLFVPGFQESHFTVEDVDIIMIYAESPDSYLSILQSPNARLHITSIGSNFTLVTEGKKSWRKIAEEIDLMSSEKIMQSDRLHAVFVREEEFEDLQMALSAAYVASNPKVKSEKRTTLLFNQRKGENSNAELDTFIRSAKAASSLAIVPVKSLDRVVDIMNSLATSIQQLAILGPKANEAANFIQNWVAAKVITVGFIYPVALSEISNGPNWQSYISPVISSPAFTRRQIVIRKKLALLPQNIADIRASYIGLIPPLKPEPCGERIGFFTQVEYLVKGLMATCGVIAIGGLIYGMRYFKQL